MPARKRIEAAPREVFNPLGALSEVELGVLSASWFPLVVVLSSGGRGGRERVLDLLRQVAVGRVERLLRGCV